MDSISALIINHEPVNTIAIKRLLLIFDKIYLLHPDENLFFIPDNVQAVDYGNMKVIGAPYVPLFKGRLYKKADEDLINSVDYAYSKGYLKLLNLKEFNFFKKYWLPLRLAYDFDTSENTLYHLAKPLLYAAEDHSAEDGVIRGGWIEPRNIHFYPTIPTAAKIFPDEEESKYFYNHQFFSIIARLNKQLLVSGEFNLIPVFLNADLNNIYFEKIILSKSNPDLKLKRAFQEQHHFQMQNVQYLLFNISQKILPDEVLNTIPIKELIIARQNTYHELSKLRRKLLSSIRFLEKYKYNEQFTKEANKYISTKLMPLIDTFNNKFLTLLVQFTKINFTFSSAFFACNLSLAQSFSPLQIAILSGISAVVGSTVNNLASFILQKDKGKMQNTFSYFLKFK